MKIIPIFLGLFTIVIFPQPEKAFNPMTALGARGIFVNHILYWENPDDVTYNEVYISSDSALVINLDPSAKILNGNPSTVYSSAPLSNLNWGTKYYWRVVQFNSLGNAIGDIWYFLTRGDYLYVEDNFSNELIEWESRGPVGMNNWNISNTAFAGGQIPELQLSPLPIFNGTSYLLNKSIFAGHSTSCAFEYSFKWVSGTSSLGVAYTTDNGLTWNSVWEISASNSIAATSVRVHFPKENYLQFAFYFIGNSADMNGWYIDSVYSSSALSLNVPPPNLYAKSDTNQLSVQLSWNAGSTESPMRYVLQKKVGLPSSIDTFATIAEFSSEILRFTDYNVQLSTNYTYRIKSLGPPGPGSSIWGNDATAYIPTVVPVELILFSGTVIDQSIHLSWATATETNNSGFEIQKYKEQSAKVEENNWNVIGFIEGKGTTTEKQFYSFIDENVEPGKYFYRLKQIDYDGSFEYSKEIEVEIGMPKEFALSQNYPNPFNPTTKIKYSIPSYQNPLPGEARGGLVTLKVYDVLGNEAAILVNEEKSPGEYEVEFDGSNLSSGIYFYQIKSADPESSSGQVFIQTNKMVLMK